MKRHENWLKTLSLSLMAILFLLVLVACSGGSESSTLSPDNEDQTENTNEESTGSGELDEIEITVTHYPTGAYAVPYNVGIEQGIFEKHGIKITEIYGSGGGGTTVRNVLSGKLPFGDVSTAAAIQAYLSGAPIKIVGGAVQSLGDLVFVTRKDDNEINEVHDLIGNTWAYTNPGSVTETVSQLIFELMDIDPDSLNVVASGGIGEGLTMLQAGEVDTSIMLEPTYSVEKDNWKELFRVSEHIKRYQQTVIITSPQLIEQNPDLVKRFLAAYQEAVDWVYENPEEAAKIFAKSAEIDEEASISAVKGLVEAEHWNSKIDIESMETTLRGMELVGTLSESTEIDWDEIFDMSLIDEAYKFEVEQLK